MFSWRGFLYYKWSMGKFWPDVMSVLREINKIQPVGAVTPTQQADLAAAAPHHHRDGAGQWQSCEQGAGGL